MQLVIFDGILPHVCNSTMQKMLNGDRWVCDGNDFVVLYLSLVLVHKLRGPAWLNIVTPLKHRNP